MKDLKQLKDKIKELQALKDDNVIPIFADGMLLAYSNVLDLVEKLTIPVVVKQSEQLFCKCGLQKGGTFSYVRIDCDSIDLDAK